MCHKVHQPSTTGALCCGGEAYKVRRLCRSCFFGSKGGRVSHILSLRTRLNEVLKISGDPVQNVCAQGVMAVQPLCEHAQQLTAGLLEFKATGRKSMNSIASSVWYLNIKQNTNKAQNGAFCWPPPNAASTVG